MSYKVYRAELESLLDSIMCERITPAGIECFNSIAAAIEHVDSLAGRMPEAAAEPSAKLDRAKLHEWVNGMDNADGSHGAHWSKDQTTAVGRSYGIDFDGDISAECWYTALNMMYSDYYPTAAKFGVDRPEFYASLAKDFLCDKDAPGGAKAKLEGYYRGIVEG